jgi:hypothetical protein
LANSRLPSDRACEVRFSECGPAPFPIGSKVIFARERRPFSRLGRAKRSWDDCILGAELGATKGKNASHFRASDTKWGTLIFDDLGCNRRIGEYNQKSRQCCWPDGTMKDFRAFRAPAISGSSRFHPPIAFHRATLVYIHWIALCYVSSPMHNAPRLRFSRS